MSTIIVILLLATSIRSAVAQTPVVITVTCPPNGNENHVMCLPVCNEVILLMPSWGVHGDSWELIPDEYIQDSIIITPANQGYWIFHHGTQSATILVRFVNPPTTPWSIDSTDNCYQGLTAQQGTYPQGTSFIWSNGATTPTIQITQIGYYSVTVTSPSSQCPIVRDTIKVVWSEPVPSLLTGGPFCLGIDTLQLDPNYTHQYAGYLWAGGATSRTISAAHSGTYSVTVTNTSGCKASSSTTLQFDATAGIEMCFVTFDTITWKNRIVWYVDPFQTDIDSVRVEVKNQIGQWISIGTVLYTDGSLIHMGSNPQQDFNEYRVVSIGHCGKGPDSQIHRSIWLSTFSNELQWQNYYGTFVPPYYVVFALMNTNAVIPVDTIPSCSGAGCINHSPIVTNPNVVKYFVAFQENCSGNKSNVWVRSNYWDILTSTEEVQKEDPLTIYPNPTTTGEIQITGPVGNYQIEVYNIDGKKVIKTRNIKNIDIGEFPNGLYFIKITTDSRTYTEKVVKL